MMLAAGYSRETSDGYEKATTVGGHPARREMERRASKRGELNVLVGDRFMVAIEGRDVDRHQDAARLRGEDRFRQDRGAEDRAQRRKPAFNGSSPSIRNVCSPVIQADPSISGTIAGFSPTCDAIDDAAPEGRADDALVHERHVVQQQAHVVQHRHHRRGAGAARRAIDFGVGEDRDVAQVRVGQLRRRGEDRAVDPFEARRRSDARRGAASRPRARSPCRACAAPADAPRRSARPPLRHRRSRRTRRRTRRRPESCGRRPAPSATARTRTTRRCGTPPTRRAPRRRDARGGRAPAPDRPACRSECPPTSACRRLCRRSTRLRRRSGASQISPRSIAIVVTAMMPWPHIVLQPSLCMNSTPACASRVTGSVSSAPYMSVWPRGSRISALRR